jgi:hypothetical protein
LNAGDMGVEAVAGMYKDVMAWRPFDTVRTPQSR